MDEEKLWKQDTQLDIKLWIANFRIDHCNEYYHLVSLTLRGPEQTPDKFN